MLFLIFRLFVDVSVLEDLDVVFEPLGLASIIKNINNCHNKSLTNIIYL